MADYYKRRVSTWNVQQAITGSTGVPFYLRVSYQFRHKREAEEQRRLLKARNPDKSYCLRRGSQTIISMGSPA